jgi:hypothetical protein
MTRFLYSTQRKPFVSSYSLDGIRDAPIVALPTDTERRPPITQRCAPLSFQAVERILSKAIEDDSLERMDYPALIGWEDLTDGTVVGVVEDGETAVRYHWTICPHTFKPRNLGPVDD